MNYLSCHRGPTVIAMTVLLTGFLTGLGLIVAIGSQNAYVLRQGLRRQHVLLIVTVCSLGDIALELAGVLGMGAIVDAHPDAVRALKWFGAAYLLWFGINAFRSARKASVMDPADAPAESRTKTVLTVVGLTFLNPHVYLDTVVMIGSLANSHGPSGRWWFYVGSVLASIVWFAALGFGAKALTPLVRNARTWQVIDVIVGVMMFAFAGMMLASA